MPARAHKATGAQLHATHAHNCRTVNRTPPPPPWAHPGSRCDIIEDVRRINEIAIGASPHKTAALILGGGVPKHHILNANLMRNGVDFAVYINTAQVRVCVRPCVL